MKLKTKVTIIILGVFFVVATWFCVVNFFPSTENIEKVESIEIPAFKIVKSKDNILEITLNEDYFFKNNTESVSITYNGTFYGLYLITDKIYLPVMTMPKVELIISMLDAEGNLVTNEAFILENSHDTKKPVLKKF